VRCHHIASRGRDVDWQLWVEDSQRCFPRRYTIVTKDVTGQPEFTVEFSDWEAGANIPEDHFAFVAPAGAQRIEFLRARERVREARAERGQRARSPRSQERQ
jgi:hypothetical protein